MNHWLLLGMAIALEVVATTLLKFSEGFTRLWPTLASLLLYGMAFFCMSRTMHVIPAGIAYAVWSGLGIVLISAIAWVFLGQKLDVPALLGMAMIVGGVLVIHVFSRSVGH